MYRSTAITIIPFPSRPDMSIERVEDLCLNYLRQTPQPVTPVELLLRHCQRDDSLEKLTLDDLLRFLRRHQEITVLEGLVKDSGMLPELLPGAALNYGPRAVLNARIPSRKDMLLMLVQQLDHMHLALNDALSSAQYTGDAARAMQVREALDKAQQLRAQFEKLLH